MNTLVMLVSLLGGVSAFGFIGIVLGPLVAAIVTALAETYVPAAPTAPAAEAPASGAATPAPTAPPPAGAAAERGAREPSPE
jgi:hypothetical protein